MANKRARAPLTYDEFFVRHKDEIEAEPDCSDDSPPPLPPEYLSNELRKVWTLKRQHEKACELAKIPVFVPYTFRHTCLTRWARILDPYTLAYLAGHSDFGTTRRYVHPNLNTAREALERAREAQRGGHHKASLRAAS